MSPTGLLITVSRDEVLALLRDKEATWRKELAQIDEWLLDIDGFLKSRGIPIHEYTDPECARAVRARARHGLLKDRRDCRASIQVMVFARGHLRHDFYELDIRTVREIGLGESEWPDDEEEFSVVSPPNISDILNSLASVFTFPPIPGHDD